MKRLVSVIGALALVFALSTSAVAQVGPRRGDADAPRMGPRRDVAPPVDRAPAPPDRPVQQAQTAAAALFALIDTDGDGQLSMAEIRTFARRLAAADTDGSGYVSRMEMREFLRELALEEARTPEIDATAREQMLRDRDEMMRQRREQMRQRMEELEAPPLDPEARRQRWQEMRERMDEREAPPLDPETRRRRMEEMRQQFEELDPETRRQLMEEMRRRTMEEGVERRGLRPRTQGN